MKRCVACESPFAAPSWACPGCGFMPVVEAGIPVLAPDLAESISGYDTSLFATHGGELADHSFWVSGRTAIIAWALRTYAPDARRFLEIGCGAGGVLKHLERQFPALELTGGEALVAGLRQATARLGRTELLQCDATRLPFEDEFDAIGAFDVIEHIGDDDRVLTSMASALRPGGVMLLTVPQHPWLFGPADTSAGHERRYTARDLKVQVTRAGFSLLFVTSFVSLLLPAMAAVRLAARWRSGPYDSADEFRIGPLNGVLTSIMDLERWTIARGARWPAGGSLLVVAQKP